MAKPDQARWEDNRPHQTRPKDIRIRPEQGQTRPDQGLNQNQTRPDQVWTRTRPDQGWTRTRPGLNQNQTRAEPEPDQGWTRPDQTRPGLNQNQNRPEDIRIRPGQNTTEGSEHCVWKAALTATESGSTKFYSILSLAMKAQSTGVVANGQGYWLLCKWREKNNNVGC